MMEINKKDLASRIVWIDWAKSICMFLVILGHCHIKESDGFVVQFIYSFHMLFFFFISGILCKASISFKKELRNIIVPYFTFGIISIFFGVIQIRSFQYDLIIMQIWKLIIGVDASIGPIWFLPALFICRMFFYIIKIIEEYNKNLYYFVFILTLMPVIYISHYKLNFPFFADSAICGLPFFLMGNECYKYLRILLDIRWIVRLFFSVVLLIISFLLSWKNGWVVIADCTIGHSVLLYYINALAAIISVVLFCTLLNNNFFRFVFVTGYGSIVSLGMHGYILVFFNYYLPILLSKTPGSYSFFMALVYALITYYICYILIVFFDRRCPVLFGLRGSLKK